MPRNHHILSPDVVTSSLTLMVGVAELWRAGKVVVLNQDGITVDGVPLRWAPAPPCLPPNIKQLLGAEDLPNIFQFVGNVWTFQFDGKRVVKVNQLGFYYIHTLLKTPCNGVDSKELVAAINCHKFKCAMPNNVLEQDYDDGSTFSARIKAADATPVDEKADQTTLQQVRHKMNSLRAELESHGAKGGEVAAKEAEAELEKLEEYLTANSHKGRSTKFNSGANKNRKSVRVAISRAIRSIAKDHPALAQHLKNSIKTGFSCCYTPEKETNWLL